MNARVFLVLSILLVGCDATCEQACDKLIRTCEAGIPSYNAETCQAECELVQTEYKAQDYLEPELSALQTELNCIQGASCEALLNTDAPACLTAETARLSIFQPVVNKSTSSESKSMNSQDPSHARAASTRSASTAP